jgi:hypothetical protein
LADEKKKQRTSSSLSDLNCYIKKRKKVAQRLRS